MEALILQSKSMADLKLLMSFAKKIGISGKFLTKEEKEEIGLFNAIKKGRTKKYVDTESFKKELRK
jgi:hypothetical protein